MVLKLISDRFFFWAGGESCSYEGQTVEWFTGPYDAVWKGTL